MPSTRWNILIVLAFVVLSACDQLDLSAPATSGQAIALEVDRAAFRQEVLERTSEQMADALRAQSIRYSGRGVRDNAARIQLADAADTPHAMEALHRIAYAPSGEEQLSLKRTENGSLEATLTDAHFERLLRQVATQSAEVINRRLFSNVWQPPEPDVRGGGRFIIHAPHSFDADRLRRVVATPGKLTFHLVRDGINDARIPSGYTLVQPHPILSGQQEIVRDRPVLTGEHITRAAPSIDRQTGALVISFQLNSEGTRIFCALTRQHTGERFAVLLDMQVLTAPTINEPICGGAGQIAGNFTGESANDLAMLLGAGSLPAPVRIIASRQAQ